MWEELTKAALLGTERTEISKDLLRFLETCQLPPVATSEEQLLKLLAIYAPMKKTSVEDLKIEIQKPPKVARSKTCSPKAAKNLNAMLGGIYANAMPEFFDLLAQKNMTLPPSALPELFEKSLTNQEFWKIIKPVLGKSGEWLLYQNENWDLLWEKEEKIDWATASKLRRIRLLSQIRNGKKPEKVIKNLTTTWAKEDWKTKVDFLKIMKIGLSEKDEKFLEECLKESRKEIRQTAANLLIKLPDGRLSTSVYNFVNNSLSLKGENLEVTFPEEIDESFSPLLNFSKKKTDLKSGLITNSFGQLFSKIPAKKWEQRFEKEPAEVLKLFLRSNKKEFLIEHLVFGLKENPSERWIANLLNLWVAGTHNLKFKEWKIEELVPAISAEAFNKIALMHIGENEALRGEHSILLKFLQNSTQDWGDDLTRRVLLPLKKHVSQLQGFDWSSWHYKEVLKIAAYRISPEFSNRLSEGWDSVGSGWEMWQFEIEQFLGCLKFRAEMHNAFNES